MKFMVFFFFCITLAFAEATKEDCLSDLKALHEARVQLQKDETAYQNAFYEHNIYKTQLYLNFKKADFEKIDIIVSQALLNCKGVLSENELHQLKEYKSYSGNLLNL
jgi:hypothetical protein